jgi:putative intracellular protease/amidase
MNNKAYMLVFDGLADWEPAHALCEIRNSGRYEVVTVGFILEPVTTMGGLRVLPDITLEAVNPDEAAIFILPGGDMWAQQTNEPLIRLLQRLNGAGVPIAAICGATLEIVRAGLTHNRRHTSNDKTWLKAIVTDYRDDDFYVNEFAVTDHQVITANGLGAVEFGQEIIKQLNLYSPADAEAWFEMFKHGVYAELPTGQ